MYKYSIPYIRITAWLNQNTAVGYGKSASKSQGVGVVNIPLPMYGALFSGVDMKLVHTLKLIVTDC